MNGAHDLGGKHGHGPINPEAEADEPVFHAEWERRVFALTLATGMLGKWNIDESRSARERQNPVAYLSHSYYENWLAGLERLLDEKQLLDSDKHASLRVPTPEDALKLLQRGGPTTLSNERSPQFQPGDTVRVQRVNAPGHTRAPQYAQGALGTIVACHGSHILPDAHSAQQRLGVYLYSVKFSEQTLWGTREQNMEVLIDLWETYLQQESRHD